MDQIMKLYMEIRNHLHITMYRTCIIGLIILLGSCNKRVNELELGSISGKINAKEPLGGFKVELFKAEQPDGISDIIYTNPDGTFEFNNLETGIYELNVTKEKYYYILMKVDDNEPNHRDSYIEVKNGEHKYVEILMGGGEHTIYKELTITDMDGNPINSLECPFDKEILSFKLFNETNESLSFNIGSSCFFTDRIRVFYYFDSFIPEYGTLKPGENSTIICNVNQDMLDLDPNDRRYMSVYSSTIEVGWPQQELDMIFID